MRLLFLSDRLLVVSVQLVAFGLKLDDWPTGKGWTFLSLLARWPHLDAKVTECLMSWVSDVWFQMSAKNFRGLKPETRKLLFSTKSQPQIADFDG
jgi:hypothetical protein